MVEQDRNQVALAWVSVHGTWYQTEESPARGYSGINRLDLLAKLQDTDCCKAKNLQDKWKADAKMIRGIDNLPGRKTMTERIVKEIMQARRRFKL